MSRLLSNEAVANIVNIPPSYINELLQAAKLIERKFDDYGLCHHTLTTLGDKFGQYKGTQTYDVGNWLNEPQLEGVQVHFDIIFWSQTVIPFLHTLIKKDVLDYHCLNDYDLYLGRQKFPAGRALKLILEMRRPATLSFTEMMVELKNNNYNDFDDSF